MTEKEIAQEILHVAKKNSEEDEENAFQRISSTNSSSSYPIYSIPEEYHVAENIYSQDSFAIFNYSKPPPEKDDDEEENIHDLQTPQDSLPFEEHAINKNSNSLELTENDIIVEKMHIHYGLKSANPISRLRFYSKNIPLDKAIGKEIKEASYPTLLPRVFEELAVRVFCRNPKKSQKLFDAFNSWCKEEHSSTPVLSMSQI
jgi:hypothetical protein